MKKTLLLISTLIISLSVDAQVQHNVFNIRNYNRSLALELKQHQAAAIVSDEYGKLISYSNPANTAAKYLHHGQEYDSDLDLYFYPSRIYSILSARFFQTDPKSQHASPYSFLGGDPVNRIDETGNADKPLVLHHSEYSMPDEKDIGFIDIQNQVGDAYYVSLGDFLTGNVPDLPEFNGTVFIDSHMATEEGGSLTTERGASKKSFKTPRKFEKATKIAGTDEYTAGIKAKDLGKQLRSFADSRNLTIKNIVAGGCEGSTAAETIGKSFMGKATKIPGKRSFKTVGLKQRNMSMFFGEKAIESQGIKGFNEETRLYVQEKGYKPMHFTVDYEGEERFESVKQLSPNHFIHPSPYANGEELEDLVRNGRVPRSLESHFQDFEFKY